MFYRQLNAEERTLIAIRLLRRLPQDNIVRRSGRAPSTIS
jgi:IS30 family transposase